ncbi:PREDICTED: uncharacterized protein LOC106813578 [Priapulus caudatus]|uniref:Uncharacterized protein LOC106813578 n=1 Tax=Priapulus caudatus TaxID=37621 RepID=A0ABM1EM20_PRICU|nr:PREDICTED: uncharacterized protein LOC106813578 [Priapulus caudatus]
MIVSRRRGAHVEKPNETEVQLPRHERDVFIIVSQKFGFFKVSPKKRTSSGMSRTYEQQKSIQKTFWDLSKVESTDGLSLDLTEVQITSQDQREIDSATRREVRRTSLEKFKDSESFSLSEDVNYRTGSRILQSGMFSIDMEETTPLYPRLKPSISIENSADHSLIKMDAMSPVPEGRESSAHGAPTPNERNTNNTIAPVRKQDVTPAMRDIEKSSGSREKSKKGKETAPPKITNISLSLGDETALHKNSKAILVKANQSTKKRADWKADNNKKAFVKK